MREGGGDEGIYCDIISLFLIFERRQEIRGRRPRAIEMTFVNKLFVCIHAFYMGIKIYGTEYHSNWLVSNEGVKGTEFDKMVIFTAIYDTDMKYVNQKMKKSHARKRREKIGQPGHFIVSVFWAAAA